ncbi:MAG: hypothetical protein QQW96_19330 [Tychonema bourrellyi B0820]|nr:hypothetical protein [Tychonema bourrellyi]MDQ2099789.1 hypothetical protein [Tychonema bourrellyi B0820]
MKQPCRLLGTDVELTPKCRVEQDAVSAIGIQGDVNICNILRNTTDRIF